MDIEPGRRLALTMMGVGIVGGTAGLAALRPGTATGAEA